MVTKLKRKHRESRVTKMCPEGIRKSRESSTVPDCVSPVYREGG